ncbi:MAG: SDR family oxidoreductase [Rhodobacteraceae bacterium]|nr:SDR family oxidoreductase [Paracoccaceae bacterium]
MRALVIGDSGGIGAALRAGLEARPEVTETVGLSRSRDGLDLRAPESFAGAFAGLAGPFHRVIIATGALSGAGTPPEKSLRQITPEAMADQFALNALGPALLLQHVVPLLPRREPAVFAALSARVGSIGDNRLGGWYSYRAAKAALNQIVHSAAIELARTHRQLVCVTLHPGTVATRFTAEYQDRHNTVSPAAAASNLLGVIDALTPAETGGFFDWSGARIPW